MTRRPIQFPQRTVGLIYAGGGGTRLWPISTTDNPKQLNTEIWHKTLLMEAFERAQKIFDLENIVIVTTEALYQKTKKLIPLPDSRFIVQPENMDTAVAMGLSALHLDTLFPNSVAITLYADHLISRLGAFRRSILAAARIAREKDAIVTIATRPSYPSEEFGYIEVGEAIDATERVYSVAGFCEKPIAEKAREMIQSGNYLWNTGIYAWSSETMLKEFKRHSPSLYGELLELRLAYVGDDYSELLQQFSKRVERASFEKKVSERSTNLLVLEADFDWKDVGNWRAMYDISKKDAHGNAIISSEACVFDTIETTNCLIMTKIPEVSLIGVENLIVVQADDKLLICHRDKTKLVKKTAAFFKKNQRR